MLTVSDPAEDLLLAPIEAIRVAAGLESDDDTQDEVLEALGLRISAEIVDACGIAVGEGAEPTLRGEELTEIFEGRSREELILSRRHNVAITSVTEDGIAVTLDARSLRSEAGLLTRWVDGSQSRWCAREIIVVYEAGFDDPLPGALVGVVTDLVRLRQAEDAVDPTEKSRTVDIPDVESIRVDRWVGAMPGTSSNAGLPAGYVARLGRFVNHGFA